MFRQSPIVGRPVSAAFLPHIRRNASGGCGRATRIGHPAGFWVQQPLKRQQHREGQLPLLAATCLSPGI